MRSVGLFCCVVSMCSLLSLNASAQAEVLGAKEVAKKIKELPDAKLDVAKEVSPADEQRKVLAKELTAYVKTRESLSPKQSAMKWLALFDGFRAIPKKESQRYYGGYGYNRDYLKDVMEGLDDPSKLSLNMVVAALPPPEAWGDLAKAIKARKASKTKQKRGNAVLLVLAELLEGDLSLTGDGMTAMSEAFTKEAGSRRSYYSGSDYALQSLRTAVRKTVGFSSRDEVVADFRKTLDSIESKAKKSQGGVDIKIPDLCRLTTEKDAGELLEKVVLMEGLTPSVRAGGKTEDLLKKVLLANIDKIKRPQWSMINSPKDFRLYEAMEKKFPVVEKKLEADESSAFVNASYNSRSDSSQESALRLYITGLIAEGRVEDAVKKAKVGEIAEQLMQYRFAGAPEGYNQAQYAASLFSFMSQMLDDKPDLPWATSYASVALMVQKEDEAMKRIDGLLAGKDVSVSSSLMLESGKSTLLLGRGNVDPAIEGLRRICARDLSDLTEDTKREAQGHVESAVRLLYKLGGLLKRDDLTKEARALAEKIGEEEEDEYRSYGVAGSIRKEVTASLIEAGKYAEAEELLQEDLVRAARQQRKARLQNSYSSSDVDSILKLGEQLHQLVGLYGEMGRHEDVVYLLDEVPWWGETELKSSGSGETYTQIARALHAVGRKKEAVDFLKARLSVRPAQDDVYEALLEFEVEGLEEWLGELYERDKFEERPLIWKAVMQQKKGKFAEAEKTIRQALKVDPTDGETGAGTRVRAYAVLAEILEALKMEKDAAFFRKVVSAVRLAEEGDEYTQAGMISKSLELYQKAEQDFVDAYCVQWRLAERLYAMGEHAEAEKHYEIAFERMPEQFGRVASFCFGCSGVFAGEHSRSVAERILVRLLKKNPKQPQVHFLLGQLRAAQGEQSKAYDHYQMAVEIDPEYLDALEEMYQLSSTLFLPKKSSDAMALTALELDPLRRHFRSGIESIADVEGAWRLVAAREKSTWDDAPVSIELKATKKAVDEALSKLGEEQRKQAERSRSYDYYGSRSSMTTSSMITDHTVVSRLVELLSK